MFFLLGLSLLILWLPLLGVGSKSTSLSPGFLHLGQSNTIWFVGSLIIFQDFLFLLGWCFGHMQSMYGLVSCRRQWMLTQGTTPHHRVWVLYFFHFLFCFCVVVNILSWLVHNTFLCLFHSSFFAFFATLVPLIRCY